jgi:hypothetical protein
MMKYFDTVIEEGWKMVRVACWTLAIAIIIALIAMVIAFRQNPNAFGVMTESQQIEYQHNADYPPTTKQ